MAQEELGRAGSFRASRIDATVLRRFMSRLFAQAGVPESAADIVADALVEADLQGLPSHGIFQAENYIARLKNGGTSPRDRGEIVVDSGCIAVIDAHDMLGQISADQAIRLAVARAEQFGAGIVAVRRGSHYGAAGRYAAMAAEAGCIGIVMANTSSVMPPPGGLDRLFGTNPIAIAIPTSHSPVIVLDMATSEGSVGKIKVAAQAGRDIPANWAVKVDGTPTTDPNEALKGLLLPTGGAKGYGLSFVVDLLCGLLSSGAWGDQVFGNARGMTSPHNSSHLFIAINVAHFRSLDGFQREADAAAERVRSSRRAPGVDRIHVPGDRKWEARQANAGTVPLEARQIETLIRLARESGVEPQELLAHCVATD
jgi:LDH2 family malate/lactate/ureidoglycolate dehydrogenase